MRKSRLNLFKSTSMLISVAGIIMILSTVIIVAYIGFSIASSGITNQISSGAQQDELANLTASYKSLEAKFDSIKSSVHESNSDEKINKYNDARLELSRAKTAIDNVESALSSGKSSAEVNNRIEFAKEKLKVANEAYNQL
ncbi:hypothetical protein [Methanobrevibacter sp. DSM 116169]|uniref:hypothetical protein n=1 Tax=Methanobrevibacter sp. DSM 116169 TaxID=3242727 RepID=UPI0038FBEF0A